MQHPRTSLPHLSSAPIRRQLVIQSLYRSITSCLSEADAEQRIEALFTALDIALQHVALCDMPSVLEEIQHRCTAPIPEKSHAISLAPFLQKEHPTPPRLTRIQRRILRGTGLNHSRHQRADQNKGGN